MCPILACRSRPKSDTGRLVQPPALYGRLPGSSSQCVLEVNTRVAIAPICVSSEQCRGKQQQQQQQQQPLFMKSVLSVSDVKRSETEQHKQDLLRRKKLEGRILEAVSISPKVERSEREIGNAG